MAKRAVKIIARASVSLFVCATISCLLPVNSAWAGSCGGTETVLLSCDNDQNGILGVLCLVVSIFTVGIGILATIGITFAGIQYLTAGGSEEQVRKAKKRIYHAVIGIAAYVLMAPLMNFLLPGGLFGCNGQNEDSGNAENSELDTPDDSGTPSQPVESREEPEDEDLGFDETSGSILETQARDEGWNQP